MSSDAIYARRLEAVTLLDGKDMDISDVSEEFRKDCIKLYCGYVVVIILSAAFLLFSLPYNDFSFSDARSSLLDVFIVLILIGTIVFCSYGIVSLWKVKYRNGFKGIRGICDNIHKSYSKYNNYTAYHCTTELGEHGIAYVDGHRHRADIGDSIVYIRVFNHDFIYADKRGKN